MWFPGRRAPLSQLSPVGEYAALDASNSVYGLRLGRVSVDFR